MAISAPLPYAPETKLGAGQNDAGVVFSFTISSNTFAVIYNFTGMGPARPIADGINPIGAMALDQLGNLYGTTTSGGANNYGTVFEVVPSSGTENVLYSFTGQADGQYPDGGVVRSPGGNLFGTTSGGGTFSSGTVFKLFAGKLVVLQAFGGTEGAAPYSGVTGLLTKSTGSLLGTTTAGGDNDQGVVWEITKSK